MNSVFRLILIGATLVGLMAFFLNNEYGQHIVADFFSLFRAKEIQAEATQFTQSSKQAEELIAQAHRQQEEFQQLLQQRQGLYDSRLEQLQATKEKMQSLHAKADTSDIETLKTMIAKYREMDQRWRNMGIKISKQAESLREINERTHRLMEKQKEQQRELVDKAKADFEKARDRAEAAQDQLQDRLRSQQDAMRDRMDALRDRMNR